MNGVNLNLLGNDITAHSVQVGESVGFRFENCDMEAFNSGVLGGIKKLC